MPIGTESTLFCGHNFENQDPVVQSPISASPGLYPLVLLRVNPGLAVIGL